MSIKLIDYLIKDNKINYKKYGLNDDDINFIKDCIIGKNIKDRINNSKSFLYDIVCNVQSGLDMDKLDYFMRDTKNTGNFLLLFIDNEFQIFLYIYLYILIYKKIFIKIKK